MPSSNEELYKKPPDPKKPEYYQGPMGKDELQGIDDPNPMNTQGPDKSTLRQKQRAEGAPDTQ